MSEAADEPDLMPDVVLRYADHAEAVIDLHLPPAGAPAAEAATGVVVLIHGGFWKQEYDRLPTRPLARSLADDGFVVATPEYRRVDGGGGWPVTGSDVRSAVALLPELLAELGQPSGPVTVLGHSAGGQLALWLAGEGLDLHRVVALAPVADLAGAARQRIGDTAVPRFMGGPPDEVDYGAADPMVGLDRRPGFPVVVLHGLADEDVPVEMSRRLVERHPWVELQELEGGHFEPIEPGTPAWDSLRRALR